MRKWAMVRVLLVATLILGMGCAAGTAFQKVDLIPEGKALVYIYRPKNLKYWSMAPAVSHNGIKIIGGVSVGGYYPHFVDPGKNEFEAGNKIFLDAKAGETYYIRIDFDEGLLLVTSKLSLVYGPQGASEIQECKLIQENK